MLYSLQHLIALKNQCRYVIFENESKPLQFFLLTQNHKIWQEARFYSPCKGKSTHIKKIKFVWDKNGLKTKEPLTVCGPTRTLPVFSFTVTVISSILYYYFHRKTSQGYRYLLLLLSYSIQLIIIIFQYFPVVYYYWQYLFEITTENYIFRDKVTLARRSCTG